MTIFLNASLMFYCCQPHGDDEFHYWSIACCQGYSGEWNSWRKPELVTVVVTQMVHQWQTCYYSNELQRGVRGNPEEYEVVTGLSRQMPLPPAGVLFVSVLIFQAKVTHAFRCLSKIAIHVTQHAHISGQLLRTPNVTSSWWFGDFALCVLHNCVHFLFV